jgi:hypothetical protein
MPTHRLNEPFTTVATWHLPETPEVKLVGTLSYQPGWTEIELHGTFNPLQGLVTRESNAIGYPVVHGTTREGELVTALRAQRNTMKVSLSSAGVAIEHETIVSRVLCFGAHVVFAQTYASMKFRIPGLVPWLGYNPASASVNDNAEKTERTWSYRINLRKLDVIRIEAIKASLEFRYQFDSASTFGTVNSVVTAWAVFTPDEPQTLRWYVEQHGKLAAMLAFLAGAPMSPDCVEVPTAEPSHVISMLPPFNHVSYCDYSTPQDFFIAKGALGDDFGQSVAKWFEVYPRVEMPSQIGLGLMATKEMWPNIEFISLMQVLEGFHRGVMDGTYLPAERYADVEEALVKAIPSNLNDDHAKSLRSRIKYGNEVSLRRRVRELLARLPKGIQERLLGKDGKLVQRWVDSRNYFTHWDESLRPGLLDGGELYHTNVRLRHFMRALFLNLMGVSSEAIDKGLAGAHRASQHLMQINDAERRRAKHQ